MEHLMAVSIGPVQGFIAAARRTRDFWMGSTILSECAKAAARWIVAQPPGSAETPQLERLIFPAPRDKMHEPSQEDTAPRQCRDLKEWDFADDMTAPLTDFNVSNVLLFRFHTDDPRDVAARIRHEVIRRWRFFVSRTLDRKIRIYDPPHAGQELPVTTELFDAALKYQCKTADDVIEFFAAWVPFDESQGNYGDARDRVMRLLNGRKACRDFEPWCGIAGQPKSSLDGARESVLKAPEDRVLPLRIRSGEQLDLVGLVKRLEFGNDAIRFPSVSRFAADPWIRAACADPRRRTEISTISEACDKLCELRLLRKRKHFANGAKENDPPKYPWWMSFHSRDRHYS
jgi:CRISPR-associated protein Cmr2